MLACGGLGHLEAGLALVHLGCVLNHMARLLAVDQGRSGEVASDRGLAGSVLLGRAVGDHGVVAGGRHCRATVMKILACRVEHVASPVCLNLLHAV